MRLLKNLLLVCALGAASSNFAQGPATTYAYLMGSSADGTVYVTEAVEIGSTDQDKAIIARFNALPKEVTSSKWNVLRVASKEEATRQFNEMGSKYATRGITVKKVQ
ncbi:MAG: hypothetical protein KDB88_01030 [Flavobacteriales bacterium]|nr:hypothetical protein [Flavobacteriales bacterium]